MIVNELVTAFSFKGNTNPLKDFNKELTTVLPKLTKLSLKIVGFGALFSKLVFDNPMAQFANRTGESVKNIQSLELASVKFGASLTSSLETTQNLSKALAQARLKGNEAFGQFGLTIINESGELKKTADILKDINKLFNSTNRVYGELADKRQKLIVLQTLGIKEDLLPLLMQTTAEYAKQIKMSEQFTLSEKQVKSIRELNNSLTETRSILGQITSLATVKYGESFTEAIDGANDFLKTNKDIVLEMSDMVLKAGLVVGAFLSLKLVVQGISFAMKGMFLPLTAGLLALETFNNRKQLEADFKFLGRKIEKTFSSKSVRGLLGVEENSPKLPVSATGKDDFGRWLDVPQLKGERSFQINGRNPSTGAVVNQTNTFNVTTDNPKVMSDVIENTVNKGIRLIQETSTRGGI